MRRFLQSFVYAWNGFVIALKMERNLRFHVCTAFHVYAAAVSFYHFSVVEYCLITLFIGGVISLELVNSALERVVSKPSPGRYRAAGIVKDMAAAAVLVLAVAAAVCGVMLFWQPPVFEQIWIFFAGVPVLLLVPVATVAASIWFVFIYGRKEVR